MLKPIALILMVTLAAPAAAQSAPQQATPAAVSKDKDPNRIICEKQEEIGTRLGGRKVCKTAAQWEAQRQQEQQDVQKEQQMITDVPSAH